MILSFSSSQSCGKGCANINIRSILIYSILLVFTGRHFCVCPMNPRAKIGQHFCVGLMNRREQKGDKNGNGIFY